MNAVILIALLASSAAAFDPENLQFTCQPQAGCEIFNACTKTSMDSLRIEMVKDLDSRLKTTSQLWNTTLEEMRDDVNKETEDAVTQLRGDLTALLNEEVDEAEKTFNSSLVEFRRDISRKMELEGTKNEDAMSVKAKETIRKMTITMKKANNQMRTANQQELTELRGEMETLIDAKIKEAAKQFAYSLLKSKNELTTSISKAMNSVKADVGNLNLNVKKAKTRCDSAISELDAKVSRSLDNILKENLTASGLEAMMDDKIKAAMSKLSFAMPFGIDFGDGDEAARPNNESLVRKGLCKVAHAGKCFWAIMPDIATPYDLASDECLLEGGQAANIYDEDHYNKIYSYLRSLIYRSSIYIDVWIGMQIDTKTGTVTYTNGTTAKFLRWELGSPATGSSFPTWTSMYLMVKKLPRSKYQGMVNSSPDNIRDAILCEI